MRPQRSGSIVLTASVAGMTAWSHAAPYCATKAAVIQLAKVAAVEYARDGIRVNCVCPGTFLSGIHDGLPQEAIDAIAAKHPLGLGDADDLRRRVLVPRERRARAGPPARRSWSTAATPRRDETHRRARAAARHELVRRARAPRAPHAGQAARGATATTSSPTRRWPAWSADVAGGLRRAASAPATSSALLSYNSIEFLATIFAANHLGAIAMPINWRLAAPELRFILEHSEARALVCDAELVDLADEATDDLDARPAPRICVGDDAVAGWERFADLAPAATRRRACRSAGDDLHRLMYTSGTTGRPKGVMLTHANLAWKNFAHITEFGFTADDVGLACGPLYHVGALDLVTTTMIAVGATTIMPPRVRRRRRWSTRSSARASPPSGSRRRWCARSSTCPASSSATSRRCG